MAKDKMEKEKNFVSAVIYVHDDAGEIEDFLGKIMETFENNFLQSEIICVDDGSSDASRDIIRKVSGQASSTNISLLTMSGYHGVERAMVAGVDLAIGDFVFEFDRVQGDFSPDTIMAVYRKSLTGYDIVSAVPEGKTSLSSKLFYFLFRKFRPEAMQSPMQTERFRILSRRAINRVSSMNKTIPYRKAVYMASGFPQGSVSYTPDAQGKENAHSHEERRYREHVAVDALLLFTDVGYRFAMFLTGLMMCVTVFVAGYVVFTYFTQSPAAGWTTTIGFLSLAFFALFAILTIIVKYLQIILGLIFRRKEVSFEGIEKLTK